MLEVFRTSYVVLDLTARRSQFLRYLQKFAEKEVIPKFAFKRHIRQILK